MTSYEMMAMEGCPRREDHVAQYEEQATETPSTEKINIKRDAVSDGYAMPLWRTTRLIAQVRRIIRDYENRWFRCASTNG